MELRRLSLKDIDLKVQLRQASDKIGDHDAQLNQICDAMEHLSAEKLS